MTKQERPRQRVTQRQTSKVPLTFYRAGESASSTESPFKKKETPAANRISRFFTRLLDGVIVIALAACLLYSLFVKDTPKVTLNSEVYHSAGVYKEAAHNYLGALKNRNKVTFSEKSIVNSLQQQFPEIAGASIELPILSETPIVHLSIANPSFILKNNGNSYVVNSAGVAAATANQLPNIQNLAVVQDRSGFKAQSGQQVMSADSVTFINDLVKQLNHARVPISQLILPPSAQEIDLKTKDTSYFVKFFLGGDVLQETGQLLAMRHQFSAAHTQPSQYLDVRVPGKAYYK